MSTIFPPSASVGQIFNNYQFDGEAWFIDGYTNYLEESTASEIYLTQVNASTTYATKSYADNSASSAAALVVDSAPATLNTLNELAAALGDDANFATTVTNSLSNKLDISSASSTYLTQSSASSTYLTQSSASSTYLTQDSASSLYLTAIQVEEKPLNFKDKTSTSNSINLNDNGKFVKVDNSSSNTIEIPLNSTSAFPIGTQITIMQTGTGQTTITASVGVTLNATPGLKLRTQWSSATVIKLDTNQWVAIGDLVA
jgi:hypothetical protein